MKILFLTKKKQKKIIDNLCNAWDSYANMIFKPDVPSSSVNILIIDYLLDFSEEVCGYRGYSILLYHISNSIENIRKENQNGV